MNAKTHTQADLKKKTGLTRMGLFLRIMSLRAAGRVKGERIWEGNVWHWEFTDAEAKAIINYKRKSKKPKS